MAASTNPYLGDTSGIGQFMTQFPVAAGTQVAPTGISSNTIMIVGFGLMAILLLMLVRK
jgi:LPXTG-motif cell wall-anchored protein